MNITQNVTDGRVEGFCPFQRRNGFIVSNWFYSVNHHDASMQNFWMRNISDSASKLDLEFIHAQSL